MTDPEETDCWTGSQNGEQRGTRNSGKGESEHRTLNIELLRKMFPASAYDLAAIRHLVKHRVGLGNVICPEGWQPMCPAWPQLKPIPRGKSRWPTSPGRTGFPAFSTSKRERWKRGFSTKTWTGLNAVGDWAARVSRRKLAGHLVHLEATVRKTA